MIFNIINKALAVLVGISLLSGFFINIFYAFTLRDSNYFYKGMMELGKSFLSPQLTIVQLVQNFPTEFTLFAYFMIFLYSIVTIFYLTLIWKFVSILIGKGINTTNPPYLVMIIVTMIIYFILTNVASFFTSGIWVLNVFPGWTELIFHPNVLLNYFSKYIPENLTNTSP